MTKKKLNLKNREPFGIFWIVQLATWNLHNSLIIRQTCVKNCPCSLGWRVGGGIWRRSGEAEYCRNIATGLLCPQKRTQMILPK
jgi:hypothetical protein